MQGLGGSTLAKVLVGAPNGIVLGLLLKVRATPTGDGAYTYTPGAGKGIGAGILANACG